MIPQGRARLVLVLSFALTGIIVPRGWMAIAPSVQGLYLIPKVRIDEVRSKNNLILYQPSRGDQCWDSHLLCAPYPNLNLRLRAPGNLGKGFAVSK